MSVDSCIALISAWVVEKWFLEVNPPGFSWGLTTIAALLLLLVNAAQSWYRYTRSNSRQDALPNASRTATDLSKSLKDMVGAIGFVPTTPCEAERKRVINNLAFVSRAYFESFA